MADNAGLLSILECPICYEYMIPPIYQCQNQHLLCSICAPTQKVCPICREKMKMTRNICMEKVSEYVAYPCNGCNEFFQLKEKVMHKRHCCQVATYNCFLLKFDGNICDWVGNSEVFEEHIDSEHKECIITLEDGHFCFDSAVDYDFIIFHDQKLFLVRVVKDTLRVSVDIRSSEKVHTYFFHIMLITCKQQDTYLYDVEVHERPEIFEGVVGSIMDKKNMRTAAKQNECLHFMASEGSFIFEGNIKKA
ncbi:E3 ubiquitin-protein ligase Siah1 [Blattella germanica]|nr:E3 ubiquitin-protein ligase Siah1 [Blattella germanica]